MTIADDHKFYRNCALLEYRGRLDEHLVILDFTEPSSQSDKGNCRIGERGNLSKRGALGNRKIETVWDDDVLPGVTDMKVFRDLPPLLIADGQDSIGGNDGHQPLDRDEDRTLEPAVVTVKNMAVINVYDAAFPAGQGAVDEGSGAPDRASLCLMCMDDVRLEFEENDDQLPENKNVLGREFTTHFRDD